MYGRILRILFAAAVLLPVSAYPQNSSINVFSPYTFYGIGDLQPQGTAATNSMGSVGVAYWNPYAINILNPASYSAAMQNTFMFDFGMSGRSDYLKSSTSKSSYNSFNMSDVAIQFPITKGMGFGFSLIPYSSVGYDVVRPETDPDIITELGIANYMYSGEGGVSQLKAGIGVQLFTGFSAGVDMIYYLGTINRYFSNTIIPVNSSDSYGSVSIRTIENISRVGMALGFQYDMVRKPEHMVTIGATFQPKTTVSKKTTMDVASSQNSDSVYHNSYHTPLEIPQKFSFGALYRSDKFVTEFDYTFQDWGGSFAANPADGVAFSAMQSYNFGMQYTPDRMNIRNRFKRWSYRAGFRYTDTYFEKNGHNISDMALTMGVGMPLRKGSNSEFSLGLELGRMGTDKYGLIRDDYFKISLGLNIFGEQWFVKHKFY